MSEAGVLPCLYDTRPPVNSGKRKQRQPAHKARRPPHIRVFMGIKTTGPKSEPSRGAGDLCWGAVLCPLLHCTLWWVHLFDSWFHFYARGLGGGDGVWRLSFHQDTLRFSPHFRASRLQSNITCVLLWEHGDVLFGYAETSCLITYSIFLWL